MASLLSIAKSAFYEPVYLVLLLPSNFQATFQLGMHISTTCIGKLAIFILNNKGKKNSISQPIPDDFFFAVAQKEFKKRLADWTIQRDCKCAMHLCLRESRVQMVSGTMPYKIDESIFMPCLITEIASWFQFCIYSYTGTGTDTDTSNVHKVIIHFDDDAFKKRNSSSLFICEILLPLSICSCMHTYVFLNIPFVFFVLFIFSNDLCRTSESDEYWKWTSSVYQKKKKTFQIVWF